MKGQEPDVTRTDSLLVKKHSAVVYLDTTLVFKKDSLITFPDTSILKIRSGQFIRWFNQYLTVEKPIENRSEEENQAKNVENNWYDGKIIEQIIIKKLDVFGTSIVDTNWVNDAELIRLGNKLHIKTSNFVIRNNLLFKEGDRISNFLLSESERILRSRPYIKDARIYVIPRKDQPGKVDVLVMEKDIWSLGMGLKFPDIDQVDVNIRERNLLGWGHELRNTFFFELDKKTEYELLYRIPSLLKSFSAAQLIYSNREDNQVADFSIDKEFVTAATRLGGGLRYRRFNGTDDNYYLQETYPQEVRYQTTNTWLGWSFPLDDSSDRNRRNLILSTGFDRAQFFDRPEISPDSNLQYQDHLLAFGSLSFSKRDYYKSNYIFGYGRTEDVPLGLRFELTGGYEYGELIDRPYVGISFAHSFRFNKLGYFSNEYAWGSFLRNGNPEQRVLKIKALYFSRLINQHGRFKQRFFTRLNATMGADRRSNEIVEIRNHHGIRSLRSNQLRGNAKFFINTSYAIFSPWKLLGFRLAFAGNIDLGYVAQSTDEIFKDLPVWGSGIIIEANNENLIFGILQLRVSYFQNAPDDTNKIGVTAGVRRSLKFPDFAARPPSVLPFSDF